MTYELTVIDKYLELYINQLKKKKIGFFDVPEEYRLCPDLVKIERKFGIRKSIRKGYDISGVGGERVANRKRWEILFICN